MADPNEILAKKEIAELKKYIEKYKKERKREAAKLAKDEFLKPPKSKEKEKMRVDTSETLTKDEKIVPFFKFEDYEDRASTLDAINEYIAEKKYLSDNLVLHIRREMMVFNELTDYLLRNEIIDHKIKYEHEGVQFEAFNEDDARDQILKRNGITYTLSQTAQEIKDEEGKVIKFEILF